MTTPQIVQERPTETITAFSGAVATLIIAFSPITLTEAQAGAILGFFTVLPMGITSLVELFKNK